MPECECGAWVSAAFARVVALDDGVQGCLDCSTREELRRGGAAGLNTPDITTSGSVGGVGR